MTTLDRPTVEKIASKVPAIRMTPFSIGFMKATVRGSWYDNTVDGEWSFYPSRPMPDATVDAIRAAVPTDVQVYSGAIHFPSSFAA